MKNLMMIWLCAATAAALGIALDMRRLKVNRVGLSPPGWAVACVFAGAFAAVPYLMLRRRVWRTLLNAAWKLVGDDSHAPAVRRERLDALRRSGLIGRPVLRACLRTLNTDQRSTVN
jgi:hypothetical protein